MAIDRVYELSVGYSTLSCEQDEGGTIQWSAHGGYAHARSQLQVLMSPTQWRAFAAHATRLTRGEHVDLLCREGVLRLTAEPRGVRASCGRQTALVETALWDKLRRWHEMVSLPHPPASLAGQLRQSRSAP